MAQTVKITPASGLLEFIGNTTSNKPYLQHDDNGNLTLTLQATKKFTVAGNLKVNGKVTMAQQTLTDGAAITWDFNSGANAKVTLAGARTLVISNMETGDTGLILVKQDAAGSRTLTLPGSSSIVGGGTYTASPAAGATDVLGVYFDGTTYWWTIGYNTVTPPLTSVGITGGDFVIANSPLTANGNIGLALATVNSTVGTFGSATAVPVITVNAKGLVTAVSATNISIPTNLDSLTDVTITSAATNQLLQFNGSQWVNWTPNYITSYTETDTLASVTGRGATTNTAVTFNGNVTLGNNADLIFRDLAGTFPTSGKGFDWELNNDGARIYAIQPSSDSIDLVFQLRDNATTNDRFVFWVDDYQGAAYDKYPLIIRGGTEFDLVSSSLYTNGTLRLSNAGVLQNVTGNISMFTNDSGYITSAPLSGYVPTSRTLSINGTSYDLSADRSWTITTPYVSKLQHAVKAGVAINKGQAVYVTSADGTNLVVGLASNASEPTSSKTMGLLDATVSTNGFANVVTEGLLAGLNTIGAAVGDPVWLGTSGNLIYGLVNKPYAPNHLVFIGIVTRVNANNGEIFVKVQNGFELKEIHDVDLITNLPSAGQLLQYNSDGLWKNWSPNYLTSYTETDTLATVTGRGATTNTASVFGGGLYARGAQNDGDYSSAALWTESYNNTTTGIAFHISGIVGKFLEMRTDQVLYWDNEQVWTTGNLTNLNQLTNGPAYITTTALSGYATQTYVNTAVSNLIDAAPSTLDTLNELAAALGDDPNFATSFTTLIGNKVSKAGDTMTGVLTINTNVAGLILNRDAVSNYNGIYYSTANVPKWFIGMRENLGSNNHIHYSEELTRDILTLNVTNGNATVFGTITASNFSGSSSGTNTGDQTNISGNAGSATVLQTARTFTIGNTGKSFNGSTNVAWSLAEIGAQVAGSYAAASHTHDDRYYTESESDTRFVNTAGDTMTGPLVITGTTSGQELFAVNGVNGRLFTVSDDLSNSLFSVNTVAGLPVIEAFANNTVNIGPFSAPIVINASGIATPSHGTSANWNSAYNDTITSAAVSGTTSKTLTLTQRDGGTVTATWTDIDTDTNTDQQTLSVNGSTLSISGGNSITLPTSGISQATADGLYVNISGDEMTGNLYISPISANPAQIQLNGSNPELYVSAKTGTARVFINREGPAHQATLMFTTTMNVFQGTAWDYTGAPMWSMGMTNNANTNSFKLGYGDIYDPTVVALEITTANTAYFKYVPYAAGNLLATQSWVTSQGYITGYTETDTLQSVTSRGSSTNTDIRIKRPANKVDNASCTELPSRVEFNNAFVAGASGYTIFNYPTSSVFRIYGDYDGNIGGQQPDIQLGLGYLTVKSSGGNIGNIGVATINPANRLQIGSVGSTGYGGNDLAIGNGTQVMAFYQASTISAWYTNTSFALMPSGAGSLGRLGIGNDNPQFKLDVTGNGRFTGNVSIGTDYNGFALNVNGTMYVIGSNIFINVGQKIVNTSDTSSIAFSDDFLNVKGALVPITDSTYNLGTTSQRWRTIYGDDLSLTGIVSANASKLSLGILDLNSGVTPAQFKIKTTIPWNYGGSDFTVNIKGFRYGTGEMVSLSIGWHYYNDEFYNRTAISNGAWAPTISLAKSPDGYVIIYIPGPDYWPKLYVESVYSSNSANAYTSGWSWTDANLSDCTLIQTVPYKNLATNISGNAATATNVAYSGLTGTVPTWNQNTTGNAATSTTFASNRTDYKGRTDNAVAGQLMWKNYGNGHTIFDASNSTSPDGGGVDASNSQIAWAPTYPTLMGWNGDGTYGVRVDSARLADSAGSAGSVTNGVYTVGDQSIAGVKTFTGTINVTASEGREITTFMPSSYTTDSLVSGHEYGWYSDFWRLGMTRSGGAAGADFVIQWNAARRLSLTSSGNFTVTGTIGSTNFSGSSSGTNTGDQTNISGNAATATYATSAGNADTVDSLHASDLVRAYSTSAGNIDSDWGQSFKTFDPVPSGTPPIASPNLRTISIGEDFGRRTQLAFNYASDQAWFRRRQDSTWQVWREFIHSGNISTQTVATAGELSSMNISQFTNNSGYLTSITSGNVTTALGYTPWHAGNDGAGSGLDADLLDGYTSDTAANVNTIVRRDSSGNIYSNYVLGSYFNASAGNSANPTIGQIWTQDTSDNYLRKSTPAHFRSQVTDSYYLSLSGGTIVNGINLGGTLGFLDGNGGYSNIIRSAGYPSEGYPDGVNYWMEYRAYGGHHFVLNVDGGVAGGANTMDDFVVWQGAIDGDKLLEVSNTGTLTIADRLVELSSIRYKTNVESLTPALDKVLQLRPVYYTKIGGTGSTEIGLIAEEVAEIYPELVKYNSEGQVDGINYTRIAPILIKTIQEQQELIKKLTERIENLENR